MIIFIAGIGIGLVIGYLVCYILNRRKKPNGEFVIDEDYDDKTVWFLNVFEPPEKLSKRKNVTFLVRKAD